MLLLTDPVDAFWTAHAARIPGQAIEVAEPGRRRFRPRAALEQALQPEAKPDAVDDAVIIAAVKATLGDRVSDVRASQRLTDSAACLVAGGRGPTASWSGCWRVRTVASARKPILEINTRHPLVKAISDAKLGARDADVADTRSVLFDQALILDGEVPVDPAAFRQAGQPARGAWTGVAGRCALTIGAIIIADGSSRNG